MLSALRRLRNTPLDPFAWSDERKRAREDLANYVDDLKLLGNIDLEANYEPARALAALPRTLRGFGHVRQANRVRLAQERTVLMRELGVGGSSDASDSPLIWSQE
jgi:indolepyruvate ferredoxin oxidoreductase